MILSVKNLSVTLENNQIIKNLSFDLNEGENLAIIGPNGSGKTVLLKTLLKMLPYTGKIKWQNEIRLGYVPQRIDADSHLPLTFKNLLEAKANILKVKHSEIEKIYDELSISKNISETPVGHLSGGQFQKALIAFALLGNPNFILFDEPTASLDQPGEEQIYELIHRLQDKYKITIILVSHDLSVVYKYSNKVLCLNRSNVCFGIPEEVLTPETLEKLYGAPHKYYHHLHTQINNNP
jgi:zinc transport system ATP-binding protein